MEDQTQAPGEYEPPPPETGAPDAPAPGAPGTGGA